jgi:hypothetical protein
MTYDIWHMTHTYTLFKPTYVPKPSYTPTVLSLANNWVPKAMVGLRAAQNPDSKTTGMYHNNRHIYTE